MGGEPAAAAVLNIGVLVFREGLEAILVLAALTANLKGEARLYRLPIGAGVVVASAASALTWLLAVRVLDDLGDSLPALQVQAATGLLAIVVLLIVMNWFFHKMYWTGWISAHTRRKQSLLRDAGRLAFAIVVGARTARFHLGSSPDLTFIVQQRLHYRRMLVLTGVLLGIVLIVMMGEQVQEMQLAGWLPTTTVVWLVPLIPSWMGLWLACFPTVETLAGQAIAILLVLGSYVLVRAR